MKECTSCKIEKELIDFHKGKSQCKECRSLSGKKYREDNREEVNRRKRLSNENNKETVK